MWDPWHQPSVPSQDELPWAHPKRSMRSGWGMEACVRGNLRSPERNALQKAVGEVDEETVREGGRRFRLPERDRII